ncbi:M15 family metallopeptidase [Chromatiaceae bacterium AAb-1]|nr:M15 family metallopeptidase [Chromatiaceae bacterium AAb-1]
MKKLILISAAALTVACSHQAEPVPDDFVDIAGLIPDVQVHMAYFGSDNFVGTPVTGYQANKCYLQQQAAAALVQAYTAAKSQGYNLWIFDCYRPQQAVDHFMRWAADLSDTRTKTEYYPALGKDQLVGQYIAEQSGHSRGSTVDLTLARQDGQGNWQPLDMGSPFDMFDPISNVGNLAITAEQEANRQLLLDIMSDAGFKVYSMEWWHFTHQPPVYTDKYFNFIVK